MYIPTYIHTYIHIYIYICIHTRTGRASIQGMFNIWPCNTWAAELSFVICAGRAKST